MHLDTAQIVLQLVKQNGGLQRPSDHATRLLSTVRVHTRPTCPETP